MGVGRSATACLLSAKPFTRNTKATPRDSDGFCRAVAAQPAAIESLCDRQGRPAAAEKVSHHILLTAACPDDAFEKGLRLLGRKPRPLARDG